MENIKFAHYGSSSFSTFSITDCLQKQVHFFFFFFFFLIINLFPADEGCHGVLPFSPLKSATRSLRDNYSPLPAAFTVCSVIANETIKERSRLKVASNKKIKKSFCLFLPLQWCLVSLIAFFSKSLVRTEEMQTVQVKQMQQIDSL